MRSPSELSRTRPFDPPQQSARALTNVWRLAIGPVALIKLPAVYRRRSGIGVFTGQGLRSGAHLGQATQAADHPGKVRAGVVIARGQRGCPQRHAASTGQRADGLSKVIQVKGSSGCHRECGLRGERVTPAQGPTVTVVTPV